MPEHDEDQHRRRNDPPRHFFHSAQPVSVRMSLGAAGTHSGLMMAKRQGVEQEQGDLEHDGPQAPRYMSPTGLPS